MSLAALMGAGCSTGPEFADPPTDGERYTLGELVYQILRSNLQRADQCAPEMVSELEQHHERFVETFDYTIDHDIEVSLPDLLGGTILPLVDSGDMPRLTDAVAKALALLIDDELDVERKALGAIVSLSKTRTTLSESQAIELVGQVLADPTIEDKVHALAGLALEDDGADLAVSSALDLARRALAEDTEPSACAALELPGLADRLLSTEGFVADPSMGAPAWSARVDANGNPLVRTSAATGTLHEPFVDADGDGVADVDALGRPVDADGAPIHIPVVGTTWARDSQGRALARDGTHLYEYYDSKQTLLAHLLRLAREAAEDGVHHDAVAVIDRALGAQLPCSDGTGTCYRYAATNHPIADLVWLLAEVARYERAAVLLDTLAKLVRDNPGVAERLLLAVGDLLRAVEESGIAITDPELVDVVIDLAPVLADIFAADNTTGESTARLLLDVVVELGDRARSFPDELEMTVDYVRLHKADECSAADPNLALSTPVDYDLPRRHVSGGVAVDNRSSLEQSVELLDNANCGSVPFTGGKTVAHVLLDLMADRSPSTVCSLVDLFLDVIDVLPGAGRFVTVEALNVIGCDGSAVYDDLQALDDLAKSGALDFYIPVLKVFKDRGQLPLVLDLFGYLADDLRKDEDADPATRSAVRRLLPAIQRLLDTDAAQVIFDLLDVMVAVEATDGDGSMADLLVDAGDHLLDGTGSVAGRRGTVAGSSLAVEMLRALRTIVARLDAGGGSARLEALIDHLAGHLQRTITVGGERRLANRNLVPVLADVLDVAGRVADRPRSEYLCWVGELQSGSEELLTGRELATGVRLLKLLDRSTHGAVLEDWLVGFLRPRPAEPDAELWGPLLQVAAALLQSDVDPADLREVLRWVGAVAGQRTGDGPEIIRIVDDMLASDENQVVLTIARTLFSPGPLETREAPVSTFATVFGDVASVRPANMCAVGEAVEYDVADAEEVLQSVVGFMTDEAGGLGAIYDLVGRRSDEVSP